MSIKMFVPRDSAALALGADEVATALILAAKERGVAIELVRNGSRGMFWLEPLVEVMTEAGRVPSIRCARDSLRILLICASKNGSHLSAWG